MQQKIILDLNKLDNILKFYQKMKLWIKKKYIKYNKNKNQLQKKRMKNYKKIMLNKSKKLSNKNNQFKNKK